MDAPGLCFVIFDTKMGSKMQRSVYCPIRTCTAKLKMWVARFRGCPYRATQNQVLLFFAPRVRGCSCVYVCVCAVSFFHRSVWCWSRSLELVTLSGLPALCHGCLYKISSLESNSLTTESTTLCRGCIMGGTYATSSIRGNSSHLNLSYNTEYIYIDFEFI